jgi:hypothetical protein
LAAGHDLVEVCRHLEIADRFGGAGGVPPMLRHTKAAVRLAQAGGIGWRA